MTAKKKDKKNSNTSGAVNRKARHEYFILERYEAGISLQGCEVKSIREGKITLNDSFVRFVKGEAYLFNCHIAPYSKIQGHLEIDPTRSRKLLLKKSEIEKIFGQASKKGHTIIPLSVYFRRGYAKVEIAVAEGKKQYDKREAIRKRMDEREARKAIKYHTRAGR